MKIKFGVITVILLVVMGCGQPLPDNKLDYAGEWQSAEMGILIEPDGTVTYKRLTDMGATSVNGSIQGFQGDDFVVGLGPFTTTFTVSETPNYQHGEWHMVIDGVRLIRVDDAY